MKVTDLLAVSALVLSGCGESAYGPLCDDYAAAGIVVTLADSSTNGRIPAGVAIVRAVAGAYADSARVSVEVFPQRQVFPLAYERPGVYRVDVSVTGYRPWAMSGITVRMESDGCHVETRSISTLMQKT